MKRFHGLDWLYVGMVISCNVWQVQVLPLLSDHFVSVQALAATVVNAHGNCLSSST